MVNDRKVGSAQIETADIGLSNDHLRVENLYENDPVLLRTRSSVTSNNRDQSRTY